MTSLGICTKYGTDEVERLSYERRALYEQAKKAYDDVILIDSRSVVYRFIRGAQRPEITLRGRDISNLNTLIVRATKGREASIAILVRSLRLCGCDVFDRADRFAAGRSSKLISTLDRFQQQTGTDSFLAFDLGGTLGMLPQLHTEGHFPLVAKPIAGRGGTGVCALSNVEEAVEHAQDFFAARKDPDEPIYLQRLMEFESEYRVLIIGGEPLGVAGKVRRTDRIAANAAQGAQFAAASVPAVVRFAVENVSHEGVVGVDVAIDTEGQLHLIEANRAPLWHAFEQATGVDVAKAIVERAARRVGRRPRSEPCGPVGRRLPTP